MRFRHPKPGTTRIKTFFAFIPVQIDQEVRWLETVKIRQEYTDHYYWQNMEFVDGER